MNPAPFGTTRTSENSWQAVVDGREVGRADHLIRLDGRAFVSIDVWDDDVFEALATRLVADLPSPLRTVVDEDDAAALQQWRAAGFEPDVRVHSYVVAAEHAIDADEPPSGGRHLVRVTGRARQPRITLLTQEPGLARSLLAAALVELRAAGATSAVLDVPEHERVTIALLGEVGARRTGTTVELVHR